MRLFLAACLLGFAAPAFAANAVYLVSCGRESSVDAARKVAAQATLYFQQLGLQTRVYVLKGPLDAASYKRLEKTDSAALFGGRDAVIEAVAKVNGKAAEFLKSTGFGSNSGEINPEVSLNPRGGDGDNIIAVALGATKTFAESTHSKLSEAAAFLIVHGAGHNANMQHAGENNGYDPVTERYAPGLYMPQTPNIMTDGGVLVRRIESKMFGPETLDTYLRSPANRSAASRASDGTEQLSIQAAYLHRFGSAPSKPVLPVL